MKLFYAYSQRDERYRDRLETFLIPLQREGLLESWHPRCVVAGSDRGQEIDCHLEQADIILLLLSPDFIASNYCGEQESRRALARHASGSAWLIPIVVRPVDWSHQPFAALQALPKDARPISRWRSADAAWLDVAQGIRRAIEFLTQRSENQAAPRHSLSPTGETLLYLSSQLLNFTLSYYVDLEQPAGIALDGILRELALPSSLDHRGRIGLLFDYGLFHKKRLLTRDRTLKDQGVKKGDTIALQVAVKQFSSTKKSRGGVYRGNLRDKQTRAAAQDELRILKEALARSGL